MASVFTIPLGRKNLTCGNADQTGSSAFESTGEGVGVVPSARRSGSVAAGEDKGPYGQQDRLEP
jgi:hypothetical protein